MSNMFTTAVSQLTDIKSNLSLSAVKEQLGATTTGLLNRKAQELRDVIQERVASVDQLLSLFTGFPQLVDSSDNLSADASEIAEMDDFIDSVNQLYPNGVTFSDSEGRVYCLKYFTESVPAPGGSTMTVRMLHWHVGDDNEKQVLVYHTYLDSPGHARAYVNPIAVTTDGSNTVSFAFLLNDLLENSSLYDMLHDVLPTISPTQQSSFDVSGVLSKYSNSKFASVRNAFADLVSAFNSAGFAGVISYIASFFNGAASVTDNNGKVVYSDNSSVVPQNFLAGVVSGIVDTAQALVSSILTVINPIVGIVAGLGMGIVSGVIKSSQWANDSDNAQVVASADVFGEMAPHSFDRGTVSFTVATDPFYSYMEKNLVVNGPNLCFSVPGGNVLLSRRQDGSNPNSAVTYSWEFHPSIFCADGQIQFLSNLVSHLKYTAVEVQTNFVRATLTRNYYPNLRGDIEEFWATCQRSTLLQNADSGYLTDADTLAALHAISLNTTMYFLWMLGFVDMMHDEILAETVYFAGQTIDPDNARDMGVPYLSVAAFIPMQGLTSATIISAHAGYDIYHSWEHLGQLAVRYGMYSAHEADDITPRQLAFGHFFDTPTSIPQKFSWALNVPKYTSGSVWAAIALGVVVTAAVVAATVAFNVWRKRKAAKLAANVNSAYDNFVRSGGDAESYKQYTKAVRQNNRWSFITGGTKYSKTDYWFPEDGGSGMDPTSANSFNDISDTVCKLIAGPDWHSEQE